MNKKLRVAFLIVIFVIGFSKNKQQYLKIVRPCFNQEFKKFQNNTNCYIYSKVYKVSQRLVEIFNQKHIDSWIIFIPTKSKISILYSTQ